MFSIRFRRVVLATPAAALLFLLPAAAHEDLLGTHYVASTGSDANDCHEPHEPCVSFTRVREHAFDGDTIKVAAGIYYPTDRELAELFYSPIKLFGGYSTADDFKTQSATQNKTYLVASKRFETAARARGFELIATDNATSQLGVSKMQAAPANCVQGGADSFPCRNIDLLAHIPLSAFSSRPASAADIWGFVDLNNQREYAVVGLSNGTAVVDITDPSNAREVAFVASFSSLWREPTVYQFFDAVANRYRAYAYVSTEARGGSVEVIDLSNLPTSAALVTRLSVISSAHTVYVSNVEYSGNTAIAGRTAHLVVAGSDVNGGAFRMYNLTNPIAPTLASAPVAGYMHDSTSFIVSDARASQCAAGHNPCEVLADFNEGSVDLWDVTDKSAPVRLSSITYPTARYVHSGWPTEDGRYLFVHDELDELRIGGLNTQIYTLDLSSLTTPVLRTSYVGSTNTTDHNGYVKGDRLYVSHYRRGLVVFDIANPNSLKEVGDLDTFTNPSADVAGTDGAWGVYPFFPSGTVVISDIDNGLFVVRDNTRNLQSRPGRIGFGVTSASVNEAQSQVTVAVRRVDGRQGAASVQYSTNAGSATAGSDFQTTSGTLNWADGDDADKVIQIPIANDSDAEGAETLSIALSNLTVAQLDGASTLTITIDDNDGASSGGGGGGGAFATWLLLCLSSLSWRVIARRRV